MSLALGVEPWLPFELLRTEPNVTDYVQAKWEHNLDLYIDYIMYLASPGNDSHGKSL